MNNYKKNEKKLEFEIIMNSPTYVLCKTGSVWNVNGCIR